MGKNHQLLNNNNKKSPFKSLFLVTKGPEKGSSSKTGSFQIIKLLYFRAHHTGTHCGPNPTAVSKIHRVRRFPPPPGCKEAPRHPAGVAVEKAMQGEETVIPSCWQWVPPSPSGASEDHVASLDFLPTQVSEEAQEDSGSSPSPTPTAEVMPGLKLPSLPITLSGEVKWRSWTSTSPWQ